MSGDFNRKRRFEDDQDNGDGFYQRPYNQHHQGFRGGFRKRQHFQPRLEPNIELAKKLHNDIRTLGETPKNFIEDLNYFAPPITKNFDIDEEIREALLKTVYGIITEQPQKILHISIFVQFVSSELPSFGESIVNHLVSKVNELLKLSIDKEYMAKSSDLGPFNTIKLIVRFLSTLSFIVNEESIIEMLNEMLDLAISLNTANDNERNPLSEAVYYNTLVSLPYAAVFNNSSSILRAGISDLLLKAEKFKIVEQNITLTKPFLNDSESKELIPMILSSVREFIGEDFSSIPAIFPTFDEISQGLQRDELKRIKINKFEIPELSSFNEIKGLDTGLGSVDGLWRTPRFTFNIFQKNLTNGLETVPKEDSYLSLIMKDILVDVIEALEFNRLEVSRQILTFSLFFNYGLFAPEGSSMDQIQKIHEANSGSELPKSTWKCEDIAIESVLSLMFKLPTVTQPFAYFHTTLVSACERAPSAVAPIIGRAIRFFYNNLNNLDFELRIRFLDWLSIQLSNFGFKWKWIEWEHDSQLNHQSLYHPKISFIKNFISKELRLINKLRIKETLTEEFHQYLDLSLFSKEQMNEYYTELFGKERLDSINLENEKNNEDGNENTQRLFYLQEGITFKSEIEKLIKIIHENANLEQVKPIIDNIRDELKVYPNPEKLLISIVFQTFAFVGNRSISHANKYINNSLQTLKELVDSEMKEMWVIESILKYWNSEPENGFLVIDIAKNLELIAPLSILKYLIKETNFGLTNVSGTESIFRILNGLTAKDSTTEFKYLFSEQLALLESVIGEIETESQEQTIEMPEMNVEFSEINEKKWKYFTILSFLRSILRKYSDEYSGFIEDLDTSVDQVIKNEQTKAQLKNWIAELPKL